jgi:hypothetical protein
MANSESLARLEIREIPQHDENTRHPSKRLAKRSLGIFNLIGVLLVVIYGCVMQTADRNTEFCSANVKRTTKVTKTATTHESSCAGKYAHAIRARQASLLNGRSVLGQPALVFLDPIADSGANSAEQFRWTQPPGVVAIDQYCVRRVTSAPANSVLVKSPARPFVRTGAGTSVLAGWHNSSWNTPIAIMSNLPLSVHRPKPTGPCVDATNCNGLKPNVHDTPLGESLDSVAQISNTVSELGAQINALSVPANGGMIVINSGTYILSTQITALSSATRPVDLVVMPGVKINVTSTEANCVIPIANGSGVDEYGGPDQGTLEGFFVGASANILDLFCNATVTGTQELMHVNGTHVRGATGMMLTGAVYEIRGLFINTVLRDNYTEHISTTSGTARVLRVRPGTSTLKITSDLDFENNNFDCGTGANCIAVDIEGVAGAAATHLTFNAGGIQHGGPGDNTLLINGNGANSGISSIKFHSVHFEAGSGGAACMAQINDASNVEIDTPSQTGPATNAFCLSESGSKLTKAIKFENLGPGGRFVNIVNNTIDSYASGANPPSSYSYLWNANQDGGDLASSRINQTVANSFAGSATLVSGTVSVIFPRSYNSAPLCTANDTSAAKAVRVQTTETTLTLSEANGTDVINWLCVGNPN